MSERLDALEQRVLKLEHDKNRVRTWAELIQELERIVCDVQVSGISLALQKLANNGRVTTGRLSSTKPYTRIVGKI